MVYNGNSDGGEANSDRRRFLRYLGAVGAAGLAGCGNDGEDTQPPASGTPTPTAEPTFDRGDENEDNGGSTDTERPTATETESSLPDTDKTFVGVVSQDPQKVQWAAPPGGGKPSLWGKKPAFWGNSNPGHVQDWNVEDPHVESIDIAPEKVTVNFQPDAYWSGGKPVDARDWGGMMYLWRHSAGLTIPDVKAGEADPSIWLMAITEFDFNGKELVVHSEPGLFDQWPEWNIRRWIYAQAGMWHWKYMKDWVETIQSMDDPWTEENQQEIAEMRPDAPPFGWGYVEPDIENAEFSGPLAPVETRGSKKIVCEVNEGHHLSDELNFEGAEFRYQEESRAIWANLKSGNLSGHVSTEIPPHVVDSFPDQYERIKAPLANGRSLTLNRHHDMFEPREVRAALMYALAPGTVAKNINRKTQVGVTSPPVELLPEGFPYEGFQDELVSYEYNTQRATELLEQAGFSRENGTWMKPDGEQFRFSIMTDSSTPVMESSIADQLSSFGIEVDIDTVNGSVFEERLQNRKYQAVPANWGTHELAWITTVFLDVLGGDPNGIYASHGISNDDLVSMLKEQGIEIVRNEYGNLALPRNRVPAEALEPFTLEIPPIGDPDGEREPFSAAKWQQKAIGLQGEKKQEIYAKLYWAYNWDLPTLPLTRANQLVMVNEEDWQYPSNDSRTWANNFFNPMWANMNFGLIQAKPD